MGYGDYNRVSRGYQVDLLSQKGLQVGFGVYKRTLGPPQSEDTLNQAKRSRSPKTL